MTLAWSPADDLPQVADQLQTVTLTFPSGSTQTVPGALRRAPRRGQATESGGRAVLAQVVWHLPQAAVPQLPPLGLILTEASGQNWIAVAVTSAAGNSRWQLTTRNIAIAGRLADRVHLQTAALTKDNHGGQHATWQTIHANVPARIQPHQANETNQDHHPQVRRYRILLGKQLALQLPLRIYQPQTKRAFHAIAITQEETLANLLTLMAEGD